jgi:hypothetical protein
VAAGVKLKLPWPPIEAGSRPLHPEEGRIGVPGRVEATVPWEEASKTSGSCFNPGQTRRHLLPLLLPIDEWYIAITAEQQI